MLSHVFVKGIHKGIQKFMLCDDCIQSLVTKARFLSPGNRFQLFDPLPRLIPCTRVDNNVTRSQHSRRWTTLLRRHHASAMCGQLIAVALAERSRKHRPQTAITDGQSRSDAIR